MLRLITAIWVLSYVAPTTACEQAEKDAITRNNLAMREISARFASCTSKSNNDARAKCWQSSKLPPMDEVAFQQIVDTHKSLITRCHWDNLHFNLADFQLKFGRFCDAWADFESIRDSSMFRSLRTLKSDAALTCVRREKPQDEPTLDRVHQSIQIFVADPVLKTSSTLRKERGRLLGTWRDVFYVEAQAVDDSKTASVIDSKDRVWEHWERYLLELRTHLNVYASALFPKRQERTVTVRQLGLARTELR